MGFLRIRRLIFTDPAASGTLWTNPRRLVRAAAWGSPGLAGRGSLSRRRVSSSCWGYIPAKAAWKPLSIRVITRDPVCAVSAVDPSVDPVINSSPGPATGPAGFVDRQVDEVVTPPAGLFQGRRLAGAIAGRAVNRCLWFASIWSDGGAAPIGRRPFDVPPGSGGGPCDPTVVVRFRAFKRDDINYILRYRILVQ